MPLVVEPIGARSLPASSSARILANVPPLRPQDTAFATPERPVCADIP